MIIKISRDHYKSVYKLIKNISHGIYPGSVCTGKNPGSVYADNEQRPKSAFVYTCGLGGTLVGDWNNDGFNRSFIEALDEVFIPMARNDHRDVLEVCGDSPEWDNVISAIPESKINDSFSVKRYRLDKISDIPAQPDDAFKIERISSDILNNKSIKNLSVLADDITAWWGTPDNYLKTGIGFTALKGNEMCGWCSSSCILDNRVDIYIETVKEYRNKGLGYAMARQMVQYCLDNNLKPEWEAMEEKDFSARIAVKLGYEPDYEYRVFEIRI